MWLENDANDLEFEILNDEIVESVKELELSSGIENEYKDVENYTSHRTGEGFIALESEMQ